MSTRFTVRGPAWLHDSAAFGRVYQDVIRALLPGLAGEIKADAALAYTDTRFASTFNVATTFSPFANITLSQLHPLFAVVENKTKPHTITARAGGRLAFMYQGHLVRPRSVNHPGTKGRNAIPPILAHYAPQFRAILTQAVREGATRA